jgi:ribonuclease E
MAKKMLIDATHAEETRVVVVDGTKVEEFDFESVNKRQLAGNIYLAKVTRVEPSLQAAFVEYGGNRHGFLAFSEIHPDYYQIPVADRQALLAEERAYAQSMDDDDRRGQQPRRRPRAEAAADPGAETVTSEASGPEAEAGTAAQPAIAGMDVIDLAADNGAAAEPEAEAADEPRERPYRAVDHASDTDDEIESVAEEDLAEEIRQPRKPRPRRYKIQEVIKVRQIMLVQVVKEERGNKGAALTTYLSLAGRYCVLMPNTARGGGISRKITNAADRKKLKDIAGEMEVPEGAGLIIRTAGAQRTKAEVKRDYEYLMRLWEQIRELTLKSIAPAPIYEEGNLIKRAIRDLYSREIDEVWVEGEAGYKAAKDFMKMIMPSHAKNVKLYTDPMPLFARYQVESYLSSMFNPTVQLKSGGYIVIGVTEALVAIDINSGRATKEGSIEETALKTNLEAADEIARQLRLRDLAGLIVIDFIDMEERKNNAAVEKRLKEKLKTDRARIQVGRISGFGLLEMSRQRLRPGMLEATTQACPHCHGTGLIRSDDNLALSILRQLEEEGTRKRSKEVLLKAPVGIVNFLMNQKREHVAGIEARYGMSIRIEADPMLISPDFSIEKFKTATRVVAPAAPVVSIDTTAMDDLEEEDEVLDEVEELSLIHI